MQKEPERPAHKAASTTVAVCNPYRTGCNHASPMIVAAVLVHEPPECYALQLLVAFLDHGLIFLSISEPGARKKKAKGT